MKEKQHKNIEESSNRRVKKNTPPYLSVRKLDNLIEILSKRNFSEVSASLLQKGGDFNKLDSILAVSALRFSGFIDKDGKATANMASLRLSGEPRRVEFEKIVRNAYKKIFEVVDSPQTLSTSELKSEMRRQYDLGERVAIAAVPAFQKMLAYAGLREESPVRKIDSTGSKIKKVRKRGAPRRTLKELDDTAISAGFAAVRVAEGRMVLDIPSELKDRIVEGDDELLYSDWSDIKTELRKFADKYIPDNLPEKGNTESQGSEQR